MLGTNDFGRELHTKSGCNMFTFFAGYRKTVERIKNVIRVLKYTALVYMRQR